MSKSVIQTAFSKGELAPSLYSRVDLASYHVGAATLRNFFVDVRGGASTRPGTQFIGVCRDSTKDVRLIPFQFSTVQTYALEFGEMYMRVILDGGQVLEPSINISAATKANPCVVTANSHGYSNGDEVYITGVGGMTQLNGGSFVISSVTTNTFALKDVFGDNINSTLYSTYTSGGTVARVFTLGTPYAASDLALLKFAQSADVITLTHPDYDAYDLTRTAHWIWTLTAINFQPLISAPTSPSATPSASGSTEYWYVITAVDATTGEESRVSTTAVAASSATMSQTAGAYVTVSWTASSGAGQYNIYRAPEIPGAAPPTGTLFGFVGSTEGVSFKDVNIAPDFSDAPPQARNPFADDNNPGAVCYYAQRKGFAASNAFPETFWLTQVGNYSNMDVSNPTRATDAITATISSQQVNAIKHMVPMQSLILLSSSGAWLISGGGAATPITPSTVDGKPQAYNGCSDVPPLVINYDIIYVQSKGSIVRDLAYNFYVNMFTGTDLSVLSNHLFFGKKITEWTWAEEPFKIVWAVRNDGLLLSLTYLKEQDVYGWARHDTQGRFRSICSISEGDVNAVYMVVERILHGRYVKCIERFANRVYNGDITQAWAVDCGLRYPLTYLNAVCSPTEATGDDVEFIIDNALFTSGMVGNRIHINNGIADIIAFNSTTSVQVRIVEPLILSTGAPGSDPIYNTFPAAVNTWSCTAPVTIVGGLSHLEGLEVAILADGNVNPNQTVTSGQITLQHAATDITIGLPFVAQLQTLYVDTGEPTIQGKRKNINAVTMRLQESRGLKVGPTFSVLTEVKERGPTIFAGTAIPLVTGDERIVIEGQWQEQGQFCIQQDYPLPASVLGVVPELVVGDDN